MASYRLLQPMNIWDDSAKGVLTDSLGAPIFQTLITSMLENFQPSNYIYNISRACLLNRSPVPAMDLKSIGINHSSFYY